MERERWTLIRQAVRQAAVTWVDSPLVEHPTAKIALVHLWSVAHDRPTCWACEPANWRGASRPKKLPGQSTMSRRMREPEFDRFLTRVGQQLDAMGPSGVTTSLLRIVDGKPMEMPLHTTDRDAHAGRGVGRISKGYKLHAIRSAKPMPDAWAVTPLKTCEKKMARRLIPRLGGTGYLLGDANYDASHLYDMARGHGLQLVCPRIKPGTGLGHNYQSPARLRVLDLLESPMALNRFGPSLYARRADIERDFAGLTVFGGGLNHLPAWVRRPWRVRRWVHGKLLINAARIVARRQNRERYA
jgi:hypothetical protein